MGDTNPGAWLDENINKNGVMCQGALH
jgi:hypothetical protein